jgi:NADPH2:quinone reductase
MCAIDVWIVSAHRSITTPTDRRSPNRDVLARSGQDRLVSREIRAVRLNSHDRAVSVELVELGPTDGASVVEMLYAGINPVDTYAAKGLVAPDAPLPRTLGGEGVGTLDGRNVLVAGGGLGTSRDGVWAEAVAAPDVSVVELPDGVELQQAAAMGVAGLTAFHVVETVGRIGPDDRVLVLGASGGVGAPICSFAASTGATVVGQTGSEDKAAAIRESGASDVLVCDAAGLTEAARDLRPTVVVDPLGGAFTSAALGAMEKRGRLVVYGTSAGADVQLNLQHVYRNHLSILSYAGLILTPQERRDGLEKALRVLAEGRMHIRIDRVLPLEQVTDGFDLIANRGLSGKVLLACR